MFVTMTVFIALLIISTNMFGETLVKNTYTEIQPTKEKGLLEGIFDTLDDVPIVNLVTPLLKIMSFQFTDVIPSWLVILLDLMLLFYAFIFLSIWKGS